MVICWDRCGDDLIIGVFEEYEITIIRSYAEGLVRLIERRAQSYATAGQGGMGDVSLPPSVTEDGRLLAILRFQIGPDEPDWVLAFFEPECLRDLSDMLQQLLDTLPERGGLVQMQTVVQVSAWILALENFATAIAAMAEETGQLSISADKASATIAWLGRISDGLYEHAARETYSSVLPWGEDSTRDD